jgi:hypothetical protein
MKMLLGTLSLTLGLATQCTSNKNKVKEIDNKIEVKGTTETGTVGLNEKGEAIIQEEIGADNELRRVEWSNNARKEELETEHDLLGRCRNDLADERLGGRGDPVPIPEIDNMKSYAQTREEMGLVGENKDLKVVRRTDFKEKLQAERQLSDSLRDMIKLVKKHNEDCQRKLGASRVRAGLPAKPYQAKGHFDQAGKWIQTRKAERSLDDAFEILAQEKGAQ